MMKQTNKRIQLVRYLMTGFIAVISLTMIISCGGGGGGGGGGGTISYTGSTEKADINASNAVELTLGAYYGGPVIEVTTNFRAAVISSNEEGIFLQGGTLFYFLPVINEIEKITISGEAARESRAIQTDTETFIGNCGGSATITIDIDDINGDFTGALEHDSYCVDGETVSGTINLSGHFDFSTDDIVNMDMSYSQLTVTSASGSVTMSGTASVDYSPSSDLLTLNYLIRDNSSGKVHKVANYVVSTLEGLGWVEVTYSSGRYYHPAYGYVEIESAVPFMLYAGNIGPSSGELIITGAGDIPTKASLEALTADTYQVSADTDGDGASDWSESYYWSTGNIAP